MNGSKKLIPGVDGWKKRRADPPTPVSLTIHVFGLGSSDVVRPFGNDRRFVSAL